MVALRPHQSEFVDQLVEAFEEHQAVALLAPPGSGKSIGNIELVRRLGVSAFYMTPTNALAQQLVDDPLISQVGPAVAVAKGHHNKDDGCKKVWERPPSGRRACDNAFYEDCDECNGARFCGDHEHAPCPYYRRLAAAQDADVALGVNPVR